MYPPARRGSRGILQLKRPTQIIQHISKTGKANKSTKTHYYACQWHREPTKWLPAVPPSSRARVTHSNCPAISIYPSAYWILQNGKLHQSVSICQRYSDHQTLIVQSNPPRKCKTGIAISDSPNLNFRSFWRAEVSQRRQMCHSGVNTIFTLSSSGFMFGGLIIWPLWFETQWNF
jgi:hypothetical protein